MNKTELVKILYALKIVFGKKQGKKLFKKLLRNLKEIIL